MELASAIETQPSQATQQPWTLLSRIAFRFCLIYFGLFYAANTLVYALLSFPKVNVPDWSASPPVRAVIFWVGAHLFGLHPPFVYSGSGSGDKTYDWVFTFCALIFTVVATTAWSFLDRRRSEYYTLQKWYWLSLRLCLGAVMFTYGLIKVIPLQMTYPSLSTLLEPFGNMSPFGVLWNSVGSSPAYEAFAGSAELLGGILLIFPLTVTLGALICLADMTEVFVLNMTYDVPVKLYSFHLMLIALLILQPHISRLASFFLLNESTQPAQRVPLFIGRRASRIGSTLIAFLWLWILALDLWGLWGPWHEYGPGRQHSALYGIWNIDSLTVDGKPQSLLVTDAQAWRRLIFDYSNYLQVERMDDSMKGYGAAIDQRTSTVTLTDNADKTWKATYTFKRGAPDRLSLDGTRAGHKSTLELHRQDEKKLQFLARRFHWVQEYPFAP